MNTQQKHEPRWTYLFLGSIAFGIFMSLRYEMIDFRGRIIVSILAFASCMLGIALASKA